MDPVTGLSYSEPAPHNFSFNSPLVLDADSGEARHYSKRLMDPVTGLSYSEPAPHNFSFNSPQGACPKCKGLGQVNLLDMEKIVPDPSVSIYNGGIVALGKYKNDLLAD